MELVKNIKGYHANYNPKCKRFVDEGHLIISESNQFLGKGMYFWDTQSNATYWKEIKHRQKPDRQVDIVAADIITEDCLDTMDENVRRCIGKAWEKYKKKHSDNEKGTPQYIKNNNVEFGRVLDILPVIKDIPVRRGIYNYNKDIESFNAYGINVTGIKNCQLSNNSKIIYVVIKAEVVANQEFWNEG